MKRELHIINELTQLTVLSDFVRKGAIELNLNENAYMKLNLALEEAVTNIILYAYPGEKNKDIFIRFESDENDLYITIIDSGIAFDPIAKENPNTTLPLDERPIGGLGIHLIKEMMTEVSYCREANKNVLKMKKEIS